MSLQCSQISHQQCDMVWWNKGLRSYGFCFNSRPYKVIIHDIWPISNFPFNTPRILNEVVGQKERPE
jgi:hypothetical protein